MAYASGKYSRAICDRCGFDYPYNDLKKEWNGLKTCPSCFEPKHPQLDPSHNVRDIETLRDSRPSVKAPTTGYGRVFSANPKDSNGVSGVPMNGTSHNDPIGNSFFVKRAITAVGEVTVGLPEAVNVSTDLSGYGLTSSLGSVTTSVEGVAVSGLAGTSALGTVTVSIPTTYTVTVASGTNSYGTGNKFYLNGSVSPTITLSEGSTYTFDQSDSSNSTHPLRFSTTANGTHGGGSEYTTGVTTYGTPGSSGAYTQITVASGAPTLYYYCTNHSGMGGQANTT